jgi:hypothetical protein
MYPRLDLEKQSVKSGSGIPDMLPKCGTFCGTNLFDFSKNQTNFRGKIAL